jgi:preprotein translocase subunit YajC
MSHLTNFITTLVLAQAEGGGDGAQKPAEGEGGSFLTTFFSGGMWIPLVLIVIVYYFLLIRPDKKKRAEAADMLSNLKKNDRVETIGGICGTVANVQKDSKYVTLKIDESSNAKLKILRSAILRVVTDEEPAETGESAPSKLGSDK